MVVVGLWCGMVVVECGVLWCSVVVVECGMVWWNGVVVWCDLTVMMSGCWFE